MKVLIDNGHAKNSVNKSPDGKVIEGTWARDMAKRLYVRLAQVGIPAHILVPEDEDIKLSERAKRANQVAKKEPCILVSIHNDASGSDGKWHDPSGWSVFVSLNASGNSKALASMMAASAEEYKLKVRRPDPLHGYWQKNLAICRDTSCPAVLVENLFQDNKEDAKYLQSEEGQVVLCEVMVEGICNYLGVQYSN